MEDDLNNICFKLKTNQSTKINLIGCDTIVNSPSFVLLWTKKIYVLVIFHVLNLKVAISPVLSHILCPGLSGQFMEYVI